MSRIRKVICDCDNTASFPGRPMDDALAILYLLGNRESIELLAQKDSARILAISDSHANANALSFVLQKFGVESDLLVFCGDGVSDIAYLLQKACEDEYFFACIPPVLAFVKGNNDSSSYTFMNKAAFAKNSGIYSAAARPRMRSSSSRQAHSRS